jgi:betaine-aldehyde dehydrogenase
MGQALLSPRSLSIGSTVNRNLRHKALSEMADRFDAHAEELGPLVTKENGKKLSEGMLEATLPGVTLRHAAGQALTDTGISATGHVS